MKEPQAVQYCKRICPTLGGVPLVVLRLRLRQSASARLWRIMPPATSVVLHQELKISHVKWYDMHRLWRKWAVISRMARNFTLDNSMILDEIRGITSSATWNLLESITPKAAWVIPNPLTRERLPCTETKGSSQALRLWLTSGFEGRKQAFK